MHIRDAVMLVFQSEEFATWHASHKEGFLAHVFVMLENPQIEEFQIGFYDPALDNMTNFLVREDDIKMLPAGEILKSDNKIQELAIDDVTLETEDALEKAVTKKQELDRTETLKQFFILQQYKDVPIFNITFFTKAFKTVNIKINAITGDIIDTTAEKLFSGL